MITKAQEIKKTLLKEIQTSLSKKDELVKEVAEIEEFVEEFLPKEANEKLKSISKEYFNDVVFPPDAKIIDLESWLIDAKKIISNYDIKNLETQTLEEKLQTVLFEDTEESQEELAREVKKLNEIILKKGSKEAVETWKGLLQDCSFNETKKFEKLDVETLSDIIDEAEYILRKFRIAAPSSKELRAESKQPLNKDSYLNFDKILSEEKEYSIAYESDSTLILEDVSIIIKDIFENLKPGEDPELLIKEVLKDKDNTRNCKFIINTQANKEITEDDYDTAINIEVSVEGKYIKPEDEADIGGWDVSSILVTDVVDENDEIVENKDLIQLAREYVAKQDLTEEIAEVLEDEE